jgi:hypothetical protein
MRHYGGIEECPVLMIAMAVIMVPLQQNRLRQAALHRGSDHSTADYRQNVDAASVRVPNACPLSIFPGRSRSGPRDRAALPPDDGNSSVYFPN